MCFVCLLLQRLRAWLRLGTVNKVQGFVNAPRWSCVSQEAGKYRDVLMAGLSRGNSWVYRPGYLGLPQNGEVNGEDHNGLPFTFFSSLYVQAEKVMLDSNVRFALMPKTVIFFMYNFDLEESLSRPREKNGIQSYLSCTCSRPSSFPTPGSISLLKRGKISEQRRSLVKLFSIK